MIDVVFLIMHPIPLSRLGHAHARHLRQGALSVFFLAAILTACARQTEEPAAQDKVDRAQAEAQLKQTMNEKAKQQNLAQWQAKQAAQQNAHDAIAAVESAQTARRQQLADPELSKAAKPRVWAPIPVPNFNIQAVFNSTWQDGYLNYRVALVGDRQAIDDFLHSYTKYGIVLAKQGGYNVLVFPISPQDFSARPDSFNQGIPTSDFSSRLPCSLDVYEDAVQWNLTWGT